MGGGTPMEAESACQMVPKRGQPPPPLAGHRICIHGVWMWVCLSMHACLPGCLPVRTWLTWTPPPPPRFALVLPWMPSPIAPPASLVIVQVRIDSLTDTASLSADFPATALPEPPPPHTSRHSIGFASADQRPRHTNWSTRRSTSHERVRDMRG